MLIIKVLDLVKSARAQALMLQPECECWHGCLLVWLWANYVTSLRCNVFIYEMGSGTSAGWIKWDATYNWRTIPHACKISVQCLAQSKYSVNVSYQYQNVYVLYFQAKTQVLFYFYIKYGYIRYFSSFHILV